VAEAAATPTSATLRSLAYALAVCLVLPSPAVSRLLGPVVSVVQENDLVVKTDRHYTQGLRLNFLAEEAPATGDAGVGRLARVLPSGTVEFEGVRWGLGVGQLIFTPRDLAARRLQSDDRPYAGYLFAAFVLQRRGHSERFAGVLDHVELDLGVIGPESLAEEAQSTVHRLRGFPLARGWHNQLETEPGAALRIARAARLADTRRQRAGEALEGLRGDFAQRRVFRDAQLAAEHEAEPLRVLQGEADVRLPHAA